MIDGFEEHPGLKETVLEIESLVVGRGVHASGFYLFNDSYLDQNSMMKAPNGTETTCWDQEDSDYCGALKVDVLTVECLDKIQKTMDLLLANNKIQWQGLLRKTFNKYFHPDVLDYDTPEMWDTLGRGDIVDVFQFQTQIGIEAIRKIKPRTLKQMSLASSAMRLMGDGGADPMDRFASFRDNPHLWYDEMKEAGLNAHEVEILERTLKPNFGCSIEQEDVMLLSMDPEICGFDIVGAHKLRKVIAKKKTDQIEAMKTKMFEEGHKRGARDQLLNYVWDFCVKPQLGYAFSAPHVVGYSMMGLIEMNLVHRFSPIYWNTACLTINAAANSDIEDNKSTNYGKIAKAIGDMQNRGVRIALPDINSSGFEFIPDEQNNQIIFGLKAINGIGDDVVKQIIQNRPYNSLDDFIQKNTFEIGAVINLIKAGCFDTLCRSMEQT